MNKELVSRAYLCEVRAEQNERGNIITGRPIVYNSRTDLGYFDEIIDSGALDGTDLTDVRFLVNHNTKGIPLARSRRNNGNSTMQLTPVTEGMDMWATVDTENNTEARALYSAVGRGDISGMSFMFSIDEERWENLESDHPTRHILKIGSIVEISAVTFPAYEATNISVQERSKEALESARAALENARQQLPASVDTELELLKARANLLTI